VHGRGFTPAERSLEARVTMVSERMASRMWPSRNPIGQQVRLSVDPPRVAPPFTPAQQHTYTVVGVIRDLPNRGELRAGIGADVYLPTEAAIPGTQLILRVREEPDRARALLLDHLTLVDPALDEVSTLRVALGMLATMLRIAFIVAMVLGGLALLLTVSGLFSVLSYVVEQRSKDIGVRMALGASAGDVARQVLFDSGRPVGIGLAGGTLLAAGVAGALMASPAASSIESTVQVLDPIAYAVSSLVIVTASLLAASAPALRASRVDPMTTLRKE
jgi:hypothetical protein